MTDIHTFCTIITESHLPWALALNSSLQKFDKDTFLWILVSDTKSINSIHLQDFPNTKILYLKDLYHIEVGRKIIDKYAHQSDEMRWSLKPVLMMYLLERFNKVLYCDCDLFFYNDYRFLIKELSANSMLLTPHWRSSKADIDTQNFVLSFVGGLYNAGFVGASFKSIIALNLWATNCLNICIKDPMKGQYVDQTHLNILPIYFDNVKSLTHRGCNVANWNMVECERTKQNNGIVLINNLYPIIFIHYTRSTIKGILNGLDADLMPHLQVFNQSLIKYGWRDELRFVTDIINNEKQEANNAKKNIFFKYKNKIKYFLKGGQ